MKIKSIVLFVLLLIPSLSLAIENRVAETTTTTGTGTVELAGARSGFVAVSDVFSTGEDIRYLIQTLSGLEWEIGTGTFTNASPDTLSRTTIESSSNSGSLVDFSAGTKYVYNTFSAEDYNANTWGTTSEVTIATGVAALSGEGSYTIDTESDDASDDLTQITGLSEGDEVLIGAEHDDRTVTVKNGTYFYINADFILNNTKDRLTLQCIGSNICVQKSRSSGGD